MTAATVRNVLRACAIGAVLLAWGQTPEAADETTGAGDTNGESAWRHLLSGNGDAARAAARSALEADILDARALVCWLHAPGDRAGLRSAIAPYAPAGTAAHDLAAGVLAARESDDARAESLFTVAIARYQENSDARGELVARHERGSLRQKGGRSGEAAEDLETALALATTANETLDAVSLSLDLANAWIKTRRNEDAAEKLVFAASEARALGIGRWVGDAEISLSVLDRWQMKLDEALTRRRTALEAYREAGYAKGEARALHYIAVIHLFTGELTKAMSRLEEAYDACMAADYPSEAGRCLGDMGAVNYYLGRHELAIRQFERAIEVGTEGNPKSWLAGMYSNLALNLLELGLYEEAIATSERALPVSRAEDDRRGEARLLGNWGWCLCQMERYSEGVAKLEEGIAVARQWSMRSDEAHFLMQKAVCLYESGDLDGTARATDEARRLRASERFYQIRSPVLQLEAALARARGERETALASLEEAMALIEGVRARSEGASSFQTSYFGGQISIYEQAIALLYEMHEADPAGGFATRAFEVAQRAKARSFLDLLTESQTDLRFRAAPRFRERETEILTQVAAIAASDRGDREIEREIGALAIELDLLEAEIREADPRYAEIRYPKPIRVSEVQKSVLEPRELLLEYFVGDDASYVWSVSPTAVRFAALPDRDSITALLNPVTDMLADYNLTGPAAGYYFEPALALSSMLIGPVYEEAEGSPRLIVAPHGPLHYLPFEALPLPGSERSAGAPRRYSEIEYLVGKHDIAYVPSIAAYARLGAAARDPWPGATDILLVGDPVLIDGGWAHLLVESGASDNLSSLAFAGSEMRAIADLFPEGEAVLLAREEARIERLRETTAGRRFGRVHFATHGVFNERRPVLSGLVLSSGGESSGGDYLATGDIFALDLACDQVVLSSCSSARGKEVTGEGIVGLARAFLHAGARSVIAALWDISDESSARFMTDYYKTVVSSPDVDPAHVLAATKRRMIERMPPGRGPDPAHPYFWAGYLLIGSPR